jgi:hypothetical protein
VPASLATRLAGIPDLALARAVVAGRLAAAGPAGFARELEPLLQRAAAGGQTARRSTVAVASWVAHALSAGEAARLLAVGAAADPEHEPLVHAAFHDGAPRAALPPRARLAEVGIARYANISGVPSRPYEGQSVESWRQLCIWMAMPRPCAFVMRPWGERTRMHHDPVFIGRLLDQRWISLRDVVVVAARRPTTPAILLAVATRDRWFCTRPVREAIAENPSTPAPLARVLALRIEKAAPAGDTPPCIFRARAK